MNSIFFSRELGNFNYHLSGNVGEKGGAIYIGENVSGGSDYEVKIVNCTFTNNIAD